MTIENSNAVGPLGIPLSDLQASLARLGRPGEIRGGDTLVLPSTNYVTKVRVRPADANHGSPDPIQARVTVASRLEPSIAEALGGQKGLMRFNSFAALGCLKSEGSEIVIESALTVFEGEGAWESLQRPLIGAAAPLWR